MENVSTNINQKKIFDKTIDIDLIIHCTAFICMLLIGADKWSIDVGVVFRVDQLFLCLLFLLIFFKKRFIIPKNNWVIVFLLFSLISIMFAIDIMRSILFYCSIIYNVVFIFYAFTNYIRLYGFKNVISLFRKTCYVQFFVLLIQMFLKVILNYELPFLPGFGEYNGIFRFNLWFYEPSYLATFLVFWFMLSCYMFLVGEDRSYLTDIIMGLIMFIISTSTTGFIGVFISFLIAYLIWPAKASKKLVVLIIVAIGTFIVFILFKDMFDQFIGRLFNSSIGEASGGRTNQWKETWQVFLDNFLFGIGPGNYGRYFGKPDDYVPSNVTLELLSTLGIFGGIAFFGFNISLILKALLCRKNLTGCNRKLLSATALGLIVFLVILQANQGYLRLYHWMFLAFVQGGIYEYESAIRKHAASLLSKRDK